MTSPKRKPASRGRKNPPVAKGPRARRRPAVPPELPLKQGLLEMATIGAQSFLWMVMVVAIIAALGGAAFAAWSVRPIPAYSSEGVTLGSPFAVTFRVENASEWFPLSGLKIRCVLMRPEAPNMAPVEADRSAIPARLEPGQSATFTCPFRAALGGATSDDLDVAQRSELYFRSQYDLPVIESVRLTDDRGPFILNNKILPPRWTAKPAK